MRKIQLVKEEEEGKDEAPASPAPPPVDCLCPFASALVPGPESAAGGIAVPGQPVTVSVQAVMGPCQGHLCALYVPGEFAGDPEGKPACGLKILVDGALETLAGGVDDDDDPGGEPVPDDDERQEEPEDEPARATG